MKFLNLDELAPTNRTITLKGKDYPVQEMTVENFIETTKAGEKMEAEKAPISEQVSQSVAMILRYSPTIPREDLVKLPMAKLTTIMKFIRGDLDEEAKPVAVEGQEPGKQ